MKIALAPLAQLASATVVFQAKIADPFPLGVPRVLNHGTVDSRELATIKTQDADNTAVGGATATNVMPPPRIDPSIGAVSPIGGSQVTQPTPATASIKPPTGQSIISW